MVKYPKKKRFNQQNRGSLLLSVRKGKVKLCLCPKRQSFFMLVRKYEK